MRRLERGNDAFELRAQLEGVERFLVGCRHVGDAAAVPEPGVLGPDAGVIEAGRYRVALENLAVVVLQQIRAVAVQHAGAPAVHGGGVPVFHVEPVPSGLDPVDRHALVIEERVEEAHRVGAAAYAGDERIGQAALALHDLLAHFLADHRLEVAHHLRIGVRTRHRADDVVGVAHVRHPVAQRFVHGVLQGAGAARHGIDLGAQELHAEHVGPLALDVGLAHEDLARQAEARAYGRHGDAVLAGARLGDDARLAHAHREQDLAEAVVDLVAAGVIELVALEVDLGTLQVIGEALGEIERARAAGVVGVEIGKLGVELRVGLRRLVGALQFEDQRHQRLGDEAAAEDAEVPALVGSAAERVELGVLRLLACRRLVCRDHVYRACGAILFKGLRPHRASLAVFAARRKRPISSTSFSPGRLSTPEETSTAVAPVRRMASATFEGVRPPASM